MRTTAEHQRDGGRAPASARLRCGAGRRAFFLLSFSSPSPLHPRDEYMLHGRRSIRMNTQHPVLLLQPILLPLQNVLFLLQRFHQVQQPPRLGDPPVVGILIFCNGHLHWRGYGGDHQFRWECRSSCGCSQGSLDFSLLPFSSLPATSGGRKGSCQRDAGPSSSSPSRHPAVCGLGVGAGNG